MDISTFNEQILFSTLRIQPTDYQNNPISVGTGFFVRGKLNRSGDESLVLLVSNKHVFEQSKSFVVNFHRKSQYGKPELGSIYRYSVSDYGKAYYPHPDAEVDLACVNFSTAVSNLHSDIYYRLIELDFFLKFTEEYLDTEQRIYYVGYPDGRFDIEKEMVPEIRTGC